MGDEPAVLLAIFGPGLTEGDSPNVEDAACLGNDVGDDDSAAATRNNIWGAIGCFLLLWTVV